MGKAPARGKAPAKGKGKKGGRAAPAAGSPLISQTNKLVIILALLAMVPFSLPTLLLLFVGMLPTLAAAFAERGTARQAWVSVGGLNFAGLSNWLLALWFSHHTLSYAIELLRTITPILVAYGASALGWALYLAMPPLVNAVTSVTSQRRVITLAAQQRKLVEQWGDAVISREIKPGDRGAVDKDDAPAPPGAPARA
ncbi:MAG TPA: acyl-CoA synthetase [Magnetospirillaceae bacterium]|jgi:hypothetical protein